MGDVLDPSAELYGRLRRECGRRADSLWAVSRALYADPELAYEEHRAARLLTGELRRAGFAVELGKAGLDTAFVARAGNGRGSCVALLLEYDALPDLGHACGHNLIAAAGLGAALTLRSVLGDAFEGTVLAVGTPAEERGGGKVTLADAGVFDGVDAALMFHPGVHDWSWAPLTAQTQVRVGFHGRAAHPTGDPTRGIDALAALIQLFNTVAVTGRRLPSGSHVQGIVTDGGRATNIVPAFAEGLFGLRAATSTALDALVAEVDVWAEGVAAATGTTVEVTRLGKGYAHFRDNDVLSERFGLHLARSGIRLTQPVGGVFLGSSDIGDVSSRIPTIHPFVAILGDEASDHTPAFARAAASERGRAVMLAAAEALACTAADVLSDPDSTRRAWDRQQQKAAAGL
ncbi:amidohydrolase [Streptomyces virginiae]|uniref:amidohydrolase n=1 Tax=Streptomyces virginiae TaxID=1961 RepID=UPI002DBDD660|nr:amidohydrolase [Streptomyces sp. CMAA1738]MEC4574621.1 amidohydrolase [Streptomyces sp. CMAA1738]